MKRIYDTNSVPERERLTYWREGVCQTYVRLDCIIPKPDVTMQGQIDFERLGNVDFSRVSMAPNSVRRSQSQIARSSDAYFIVSLQIEGRSRTVQNGRTAQLEPYCFSIHDSIQPYECHYDTPALIYFLMVQRVRFERSIKDMDRIVARRFTASSGIGRLLAETLAYVNDNGHSLGHHQKIHLSESIESLLLAGISLPDAPLELDSPKTIGLYKSRIKAFIRDRLNDPDLSVSQIAHHLRCSPSTVHRAFSGEDCSVMELIWKMRLDAARCDLCSPALMNLTISEIAFSWGFNNAAHFSRAFRARFDCSAREMRNDCAGLNRR